MGRFTKRLIGGIAAVSLLAGGAFAQQWLLDDLEHGSNENRLGQYWYYFVGDDHDLLETATMNDHAAIVTNSGPGDEFGPLSFKATPRADIAGLPATAGSFVASMQFRNVQKVAMTDPEHVLAKSYPVVGMGTLLTNDDDVGFGSNFSKVTHIEFDMWTSDDYVVIFKVETIENSPTGPYAPGSSCVPTEDEKSKPIHKGCNPSNAYGIKIESDAGIWKTHRISITPVTTYPGTALGGTVGTTVPASPTASAGDLAQFGWWGWAFNFVPANVTKLAWQLNVEDNPAALDAGTLVIDNVRFIGPQLDNDFFIPANECRTCVGRTLPTPNLLVGDFSPASDNQGNLSTRANFLGYYWYHYTDAEAGGDAFVPMNSTGTNDGGLIWDDYAAELFNCPDPSTPDIGCAQGWVMDVEGRGPDGANAAFIIYDILEPTFSHHITGMEISSFAGIGTNLYDAEAEVGDRVFYDASEQKGIYFQFKATGDMVGRYLVVEIADHLDIAQADRPEGDDGQVWHTKIPVANTNWNSVVINFTELSLPLWLSNSDRRWPQRNDGGPDLTKLAKIQFKYEGAGDGTLAIADVRFHGSDQVSVRHISSRARTTGIRASYNRGTVNVNWSAPQQIAGGKVQLINTKGRVVSSAPISNVSGSRITANLGRSTLASGMYFVRIDARDVNGKRVVQQAPISIVR